MRNYKSLTALGENPVEMLSDASSTLAISTNLIAGRALEWVDWKGARPAVSRRVLRHEKPTMFRQARLPSKTDLTGNEAGFFDYYKPY